MRHSLTTSCSQSPRPQLSVIACLMAALLSAPAVAQETWSVFSNKHDSHKVYATQQDAVDAYFFINQQNQNDPTGNYRCWMYYWTQYADPARSTTAKWVNGQQVLNCTWPAPGTGSEADATYGITTEINCSASSADPLCFQLTGPLQAKNAGPSCGDGKNPVGAVSCGNPINVGSGNKYNVVTDFEIPGSPWLNFTRYYNAQVQKADGFALGLAWRHSFDYQLQVLSAGTIQLLRPDGAIKSFSSTGQGTPDELGKVTVLHSSNGTVIGYSYDNGDGVTEAYNALGQLTQIAFLQGGFINFTYGANVARPTQATDHFGRSLVFAYNNAQQLVSVKTPNGNFYKFGFDSLGQLTTRTAPDNTVIRYGYNAAKQLVAVYDETNTQVAAYSYDTQGRGKTTESANGVDKYSVTYATSGNTITTPSGASIGYTFTSYQGTPRQTLQTISCAATADCVAPQPTVSSYDDNGNLVSFVDELGNKTCNAFSARNLLTKSVEYLSATADCAAALAAPPSANPTRTTVISWHPTLRSPSEIYAPATKTTFTYDSFGRVLSVAVNASLGNGSGSEGANAPVSSLTKKTSFKYNEWGQVTEVDGPRTDVSDITTFAYVNAGPGKAGNLYQVIPPVDTNYYTEFESYDQEGRPTLIYHMGSTALGLTYDNRGRLTVQDEDGMVTHYTYNSRGLLDTATFPAGNTLTNTYDAAHRLLKTVDEAGNSVNVSLDNSSNVLATQVKKAVLLLPDEVTLTVSQAYDGLNRVLSRTGAQVVSPLQGLLTP